MGMNRVDLKYHIVTFGCQMNKSDSERVRTVIENIGYTWTDQEKEASLLGVLACSVRQKSIDKVYARISKWNKWKNSRNLLTFITGCVLPADQGGFLRLFDLMFSITELPQLPGIIQQYGVVTPFSLNGYNSEENALHRNVPKLAVEKNPKQAISAKPVISLPDERIREFWQLKPTYVSEFEAYIPIQNGCDKFCTFCAVPFTRGREISRSLHDILDELKQLVESGYKLITLLGQNVNSYGLDRKGQEITFPGLLKAIGEYGKKTDKKFWVYFTSPHPGDMTDEVLHMISNYECLANQIHLPMQSGDNQILSRMNRKHSIQDYEKIIHAIRELLPSATLFTDVIVGFSGENRQQFENTRQAMERIKFNMAYIAAYSPRPGAASARWEDDVPGPEKKERLHLLTNVLIRHSHAYNRSLIGRTVRVMITGADRKQGNLAGITEGRIVVRFPSNDISKIGTFAWLKVIEAAPLSVEGELVADKEPASIAE